MVKVKKYAGLHRNGVEVGIKNPTITQSKTLTAETIAESLKRPLYMVSVGELGTDVASLEENLRNILQVSASWNAVLLIDEVDIFLEKRDLDVHRNALVGVFLRLLEYYNGILFMTTNRVEQIDPAFYSRISLAISYPELSKEARNSIWKGQMELYSIELSKEDMEILSTYNLNGRQIKNCVRIVNALCLRNDIIPNLNNFTEVISKIEDFDKILSNQN
jgi:SpoVK/Ycf46/Vps4 family AAA+-type ATPase